MTSEEVQMYLDNLGEVRMLLDFAQNRYAFSKLGEEGRKSLLEPSTGPDDLNTRAWEAYQSPYRGVAEERAEPLSIHPITAEAIAAWIEEGGLGSSLEAARVWRTDIWPVWRRVLATIRAA